MARVNPGYSLGSARMTHGSGASSAMDIVSSVKEIIGLGLEIQKSIEKVRLNKQLGAKLSKEIGRDLRELESLLQEYSFTPSDALYAALGQVKEELTDAHELCVKLIPSANNTKALSVAKARFKAWRKSDDIESELLLLPDLVTANSMNRHIPLLGLNEPLIRIAGMLETYLIGTAAGVQIVQQVSVIGCNDHTSIEYQYIYVLATRLLDFVDFTAHVEATIQWNLLSHMSDPIRITLDVVMHILRLLKQHKDFGDEIPIQQSALDLSLVAAGLAGLEQHDNAQRLRFWVLKLYRYLSRRELGFLPDLAFHLSLVRIPAIVDGIAQAFEASYNGAKEARQHYILLLQFGSPHIESRHPHTKSYWFLRNRTNDAFGNPLLLLQNADHFRLGFDIDNTNLTDSETFCTILHTCGRHHESLEILDELISHHGLNLWKRRMRAQCLIGLQRHEDGLIETRDLLVAFEQDINVGLLGCGDTEGLDILSVVLAGIGAREEAVQVRAKADIAWEQNLGCLHTWHSKDFILEAFLITEVIEDVPDKRSSSSPVSAIEIPWASLPDDASITATVTLVNASETETQDLKSPFVTDTEPPPSPVQLEPSLHDDVVFQVTRSCLNATLRCGLLYLTALTALLIAVK
ncbi:hypothetical protein C8J56DRAFT_1112749 [Mycena floridula]|nr:hypothetical protein C8J56DRAFT_1112749 [Mycena floridula]